MSPKQFNYKYTEEMAKKISEELFLFINKTLKEKKHFSLILSGGTTPLKIFKTLKESYLGKIPWNKLNIFWLDERYVLESSPDSNFGNAKRALFSENLQAKLYPIPTELPEKKCCESYEKILKKQQDFDYALIGFGEDGHIASLFKKEQDSSESLVVCTSHPNGQKRISMTSILFNSAHKKVLIGNGDTKKKVLGQYLNNKNKELPIHLLEKKGLEIHFANHVNPSRNT